MAYHPRKLSLPEAEALVGELTGSTDPREELLRALQDGSLVAVAGVISEGAHIFSKGRQGSSFDGDLGTAWWAWPSIVDWGTSSALYLAASSVGPDAIAMNIRIGGDAILALWGKKPEPERESVKQRSEVARSFPGRPSVMAAIKREMKRRAEANELLPTVTEESRYLEGWAERNFPGQETPKWKSIKNALGSTYRSLKGAPEIK